MKELLTKIPAKYFCSDKAIKHNHTTRTKKRKIKQILRAIDTLEELKIKVTYEYCP